MKEPNYLMKIMTIGIELDKLEVLKTKRYFTERSSTKQMKVVTFCKSFGLHFKYANQLYDYNNQLHVLI